MVEIEVTGKRVDVLFITIQKCLACHLLLYNLFLQLQMTLLSPQTLTMHHYFHIAPLFIYVFKLCLFFNNSIKSPFKLYMKLVSFLLNFKLLLLSCAFGLGTSTISFQMSNPQRSQLSFSTLQLLQILLINTL